MSTCRLSLAGLTFEFVGPESCIALFCNRATPFLTNDPPDFHIELIKTRAKLSDIKEESEDFLSYSESQRGFSIEIHGREAKAELHTRFASFAVLDLLLQRELLKLGGLVLHAAGGVFQNQGWLLLGPSGAGKSTAAYHAGFQKVLSDERILVRPTSNGFEMWSTPFWSRPRRKPMIADKAALNVIAWLKKAPPSDLTPRFQKTEISEIIKDLLKCATIYQSEQQSVRAFENACELASSVQGGELQFPKEGPWIFQIIQRT